jgi:hypothetical protein
MLVMPWLDLDLQIEPFPECRFAETNAASAI